MNIFDLTTSYQQVYNQIENGEDEQVYLDTLDSINEAIEDKAEGYVKIIKSIEGDNDAITKEVTRLQERKKRNTNAIKRLKENLQIAMEETNQDKIKTKLFSIGIQNNPPKIDIKSDQSIPKEFWTEQAPTIDKKSLLAYLKEGKEVDGVELKQDSSIRIR